MNNSDDVKKKLAAVEEEKKLFLAQQELKNLKSNGSRARSVTVGTAFGGVTEISLRGDGGESLWCLLQPVEVTELIHQLAGNIGCHIAIQPRKDFASWRAWKDDTVMLPNGMAVNGNMLTSQHAPHANDLALSNDVGKDTTVKEDLKIIARVRNKNEHPLAAEKNINKRKSKRTPAAT